MTHLPEACLVAWVAWAAWAWTCKVSRWPSSGHHLLADKHKKGRSDAAFSVLTGESADQKKAAGQRLCSLGRLFLSAISAARPFPFFLVALDQHGHQSVWALMASFSCLWMSLACSLASLAACLAAYLQARSALEPRPAVLQSATSSSFCASVMFLRAL